MANISWNSTSINNFFNKSLGNPSYSFGNMYSTLSDSALIKSGTYGKLMDSYYSSVKSSDSSSDSSSKKATTVLDDILNHEKKESTVKNKVLDELLSDEPKTATVKNTVLDKLLSQDDEPSDGTVVEKTSASSSVGTTYTNDATKTTTQSATVLDELV